MKSFKILKMDNCASEIFEGETNIFVKQIHEACRSALLSEVTCVFAQLVDYLKPKDLHGVGLVDSSTVHAMYRQSKGYVNFLFSGSSVIIYAVPTSEEGGNRTLYSSHELDEALVSTLLGLVKEAVFEEGVFIAQDGYTYVTELEEVK